MLDKGPVLIVPAPTFTSIKINAIGWPLSTGAHKIDGLLVPEAEPLVAVARLDCNLSQVR